ncbi:MAG TPA: hypothetical protein VLQ48_00295 [Chloroflexia bacterium]|nr:hypothetical protein [Chloroflexia bacterium]
MNRNSNQQITANLYALLARLERHSYFTAKSDLPENGVYFFFEEGETIIVNDGPVQRIVRIGTHKTDGRFPGRIDNHYGARKRLSGSRTGSIFRKHLGAALLRRVNTEDPRIQIWLSQESLKFPAVETMVSRQLRDKFTFSCLQVSESTLRLKLERGLIALLAQYPIGIASDLWLGHYAATPVIRNSGLWNVQHVDDPVVTICEWEQLLADSEAT